MFVLNALSRLVRHWETRRAAAALRSLSDHQLKDMGLSRGEIEFAVKGFLSR